MKSNKILIAQCNPDADLNKNRASEMCGLTKGKFYILKEDENKYLDQWVWVTNDDGRTIHALRGRFSNFRQTTQEDFDKLSKMKIIRG